MTFVIENIYDKSFFIPEGKESNIEENASAGLMLTLDGMSAMHIKIKALFNKSINHLTF